MLTVIYHKNKEPMRYLLILTMVVICSSNSKADVGSFDVIELFDGNSIIYTTIESPGFLNKEELKYYTWTGEYLGSVEKYLFQKYQDNDSIAVYYSITELNIGNLDSIYLGTPDSILFILNGKHMRTKSELTEKYKVVSAYRGNSAGLTYTESITNKDNIWVSTNQFVKLFGFEYGTCDMSLYGIHDKVSHDEILSIKTEINKLLKEDRYEEFQELLKILRVRKILMLGSCSC